MFAEVPTEKGKDYMSEPVSHLVHTTAGALEESRASTTEVVQLHRGERSSAGERLLHTQDVAGSIPAVPTVPDPIADMLADETWRLKVEERFWPKVMKPLGWDQCWPWSGTKDPKGYGGFKLKSYVTARASRVAYALYYNLSPGRLFVCHHCDNPICVNPTHLFLGTVQDNSADMVRKGRAATHDGRGEKNRAAKLNAAQVVTIRDLIRAGLTNKAIGVRFGVTHQLISKIRRGVAWGEPAMQKPYASLRRTA